MKAFVHGSSSLAVELVLIFFSNVSLMGPPPPIANWIFLARADDHPAPGQVVGHDDLTALDEMGIDSVADLGMAAAYSDFAELIGSLDVLSCSCGNGRQTVGHRKPVVNPCQIFRDIPQPLPQLAVGGGSRESDRAGLAAQFEPARRRIETARRDRGVSSGEQRRASGFRR